MDSTIFVTASGYIYRPVKGVSSAFAILFATSAVLFIFQNSKYKSWPLLWLLPCTSIIFTAGFICREYNSFHPQNDSASLGLLFSGVLPLPPSLSRHRHAAPPLPALAFYNLGYSRLVHSGSIQSALALLKASLILLLISNISFLVILALFHRRCFTAKVFHENANRNIKILAFTLYTLGTLILLRNIFRTVQIFSPPHSLAWRTEAFFWVFDAIPLLLCTLLLNTLYPGKLLLVRADDTHCSS
ncbi:hypothetical protein K432DRAFT_445492 [Lepidopterella palustris CBS 459.81]|uniref:Uncharacterized protein n=1 Tax=Lepidopterella palustris CBS 459.81 TaxID=1314670 RepID=A0A8E2E4G6_9PEZI|nr:hypothetical protein K432DRAFT_445492 [Lepidopterella palustris CBS 459.81]